MSRESVGTVSVGLCGKILDKKQKGLLAKNVEDDIEDYKKKDDVLSSMGYEFVDYTPKVNDIECVEIDFGEENVIVSVTPCALAEDRDICKLIGTIVWQNIKDF